MPSSEAFRQEYRGSWAPADALWWAEHPGTVAPSGLIDPAVEVRALRDALYGPNVTAADRDAFLRADRALKAEQAEVARAAARSGRPFQSSLQPPPDAPVPSVLSIETASRRRRRAWLLAVPAAVVVLVGIASVAAGTAAHPVARSSSPPASRHAPALTASFDSPVSLTLGQQRSNAGVIASAFGHTNPNASDFVTVETGQAAWANSIGCAYIGGFVRMSATGAPVDTRVQLIAGNGGSTRFRVVAILKKSDTVTFSIWAAPHGAAARPSPAEPTLQAQTAAPSPLVVGAAFTTDRPADLRRLQVTTGAGTPFRVELEACQAE